MKVWRSIEGRQAACPHALKILGEVEADLRKIGDRRSRVVSIGILAHYFDTYDFEVVVELSPGATLAVRYGSVDEDDRDGDPEDRDGGAVAYLVVSTIEELQAMGADVLADVLHRLRMRTRQVLAGWSAEGTHVVLRDIRLVRNEHYANVGGLPIGISLLGLDNRLLPAVLRDEFDHPDLLEETLASWRPTLDQRYALHRALSEQGADGLVDQLVVNAIATHMDVGEALRQIASGVWPDLPGSLTVFEENGCFRCHGHDPLNNHFGWNRDTITVSGMTLPATVLTAKCGRPVTELATHAVLSEDMTILDASSNSDQFGHCVKITIGQRQLAFCGTSGRVWPLDPALGTMPQIEDVDHDEA